MTTETAAVPGYCVDPQCGCHTGGFPGPGQVIDGRPPDCCRRCGRRGPPPVTIVMAPTVIPELDMVQRVEATRQQHAATLQEFHRVWYECGHTWAWTSFLGVGMMKNPLDLWIYQDLITRQRPQTIIETGTYAGGSALWFALMLEALGLEDAHVFTIDRDDHRTIEHDRITFLAGDSTDPELVAALATEIRRPLLISLDADHSADHVARELALYAPLVAVGEYLVVEDTNVSWGGERGARGGIEDYLARHPGEFRQDVLCEKYLLTCHPGGWLQRVARCEH